MFNFPKQTEINKRIPKQKFYENLNVKPADKKLFVEQIESVYWQNKISPELINIKAGDKVKEIELFRINVTSDNVNKQILKLIDENIPYYIIFVLQYNNKYQLWASYKKPVQSEKSSFKVVTYYNTEWINSDSVDLNISSINLDKVYEHFIRQISGEQIEHYFKNNDDMSIENAIELDLQRQKILKEVEKLEKQARAEKQPKQKYELVIKIQKLKQGII